MRFGLHYHEHILAKWAAQYIDYNGLRALIRGAAQRGDTAFEEVLELFKTQIEASRSFLEQRHASLRQWDDRYGIRFQLPSKPEVWHTSAKTCESELAFFQKYYEELLIDLRDLESFNAVTEAAVRRLFDKFIVSYPDRSKCLEDARDQWMVRQCAANKVSHDERLRIFELFCVLREVRGDPRTPRRSLAEEALMRHQLPDGLDTRQIYQFCVKDDSDTIAACIRNCTEPGYHLGTTLNTFIGDLLILAMLLNSTNTTRLLLFFIQQRNLAINMHHVSVILALWQCQDKDKEFNGHLAETLCGTATISSFFPGTSKLEKPVLHFAAQYGYVELCKAFVRKVSEAENQVLEALLFRDSEKNTPMHYAILSRNTDIFSAMINTTATYLPNMKAVSETASLLGELLLLAVRTNNAEIVDIITSEHIGLKAASASETALYAASQTGKVELVQSIVRSMCKAGDHLNEKTKGSGWTSLMVACANGHERVVSCLLAAGADPRMKDSRGWTAQEHAAFRGHLALSELLALAVVGESGDGPASCSGSVQNKNPRTLSDGQKVIVVNLGSVQGGHERPVFRLPASDIRNTHELEKPVRLMLEISMPRNESHWIPVPLLHDYTNEPFVFVVNEDVPPQIIVRLYHWNSPKSRLLLSGGTVVLGQDGEKFGSKRESMLRETTVFMMKKDAMEAAGTVLLSYVVVNAFAGLRSACSSSYRRQPNAPPRLIGHRGLGQNTASQSSLQLGENTAMSFLSAAKLGASFIEFDLQLTRDLEAVVFHDFSLSELGTDVPIHDVTLAQYKHASSLQGPQEALSTILNGDAKGAIEPRQRQRTFSTGEESMLRSLQLKERLLYTVDFQNKGFKPNTRGHSIQDTLATLDELLLKLPEDMGFNIEMKYPRVHEAIEAGVAPVTIDINTFVDTALEKLERLAGRRPIILSSFTPEICILLSLKQSTYPVMFITNAGKVPMADKELRAASLQMAVQFARRWNLDGIVLACETFVHCPRFIKFVQNAGLLCASYGLLNNDPNIARLQADAGIDIIIADKVKLIADELNKEIAE